MKGDPLNPRYTRVEDKVGLMIRGHIRPDQMIETEVMIQAMMQDKIIKVIDSEEISEETIDKTVENGTGAKEIAMVIEVEIGIGQEREPLQEIIEGIEALIVIDLDQGPEQVQTGIE